MPTRSVPRPSDGPLPAVDAARLAEHALGTTGRGIDPTVVAGSPSVGAELVASRSGARDPADFGRYRVLEELGRGGMGIVYRAHDETLGRDVALKLLQVAGRVDDETIERFQREARAAAALDHPNIVRVHDVGKLPSGSPYYTMEMLAGQDLAHAIADGPIAPKDAVEAVRQVSLALQCAHQRGILHRDIKPQNIFLRREPVLGQPADTPTVTVEPASAGLEVHALLLDFGLAKLAERDLGAHVEGSQGRKSMQSLTRSGEIFGTPAYMSPEQTRGAKDVDARADLYSLGAVLYHALAGCPPFDAGSLAELLLKVQRQDASPPSVRNREIDADLDTIALKCLQKDPKDRYQSAGDLAEECGRWLAGESIAARPIGPVGRLWRRARRNKAFAIPVAALSFCLLAGLAMWGGFALRKHLTVRAGISQARGLLDGPSTRDALDRICGGRAAPLDDAEVHRLADLIDQAVREALAGVAEAQALAAEDREVRGVVARIHVSQGRAAYARYRRHRDDVARKEAEDLVAETSALAESGKAPPLEERRLKRVESWKRSEALREARRLRGVNWSAAVAAFTDALKHVDDEPEAARTLAELFWDEYRRAEVDRQVSEAQRLEPLIVRYGGREFENRVRGERQVAVKFLLPPSFAEDAVDAWLFEYRPCDKPPVLVPVPFDLKRGRAVQDRVPELTSDPTEWEPLPLDSLGGAGSAGPRLPEVEIGALESRVESVRWGTVYPLARQDVNRVRLGAADGGASWAATLPKGWYLLWFPAGQGIHETRYPFEVAREYEWNERCELPPEGAVPPLPPNMDAPEATRYWPYLPPGPYRASGDRDSQQSLPRAAAVLRVPEGRPLAEVQHPRSDGCWMARFEVTCRMYLDYLNDREWHAACAPPCGDWGHVPRKAPDATKETTHWPRVDEPAASGPRKFSLPRRWEDRPVLGISWTDASDYCRWLTARMGGQEWEFQLPTEDEWERAARGPDGRFFPWSDRFDPAFCRMGESRPEMDPLQPEPFGLFPIDESILSLRDLAGGMREWTATPQGGRNPWLVTKGGGWGGIGSHCRSAYRVGIAPWYLYDNLGFRLVARRARR